MKLGRARDIALKPRERSEKREREKKKSAIKRKEERGLPSADQRVAEMMREKEINKKAARRISPPPLRAAAGLEAGTRSKSFVQHHSGWITTESTDLSQIHFSVTRATIAGPFTFDPCSGSPRSIAKSIGSSGGNDDSWRTYAERQKRDT